MNIENKISTIRKAIKGSAERRAEEESLDKPKERHYKKTLAFYRLTKIINPKMYEFMIINGAKGKELKDEMGTELYKIFTDVLGDVTGRDENKVKTEVEQIKKTQNLTSKELNQEILKLNKKFIQEKDEELRKDTRLISAFSGKEELLEKAINFTSSSMIGLLETNEKSSDIDR